MVYYSGDNNLSDYMEGLLTRLQRIKIKSDINVLIQFDGNKPQDSKLLRLTSNKLEVLQENIEYDMGNPQTLTQFVSFARQYYPAPNYALLISAHGRGILNLPSDDGSFTNKDETFTYLASSPDDSAGSYILEEELAKELSQVLGNEKLDLLVYNSCYMANFEVLATLAPIAKTLIASEYSIVVNKNTASDGENKKRIGISFEEIIKALNKDPQINSDAISTIVLDEWQQSYSDFYLYSPYEDSHYRIDSTLTTFNLAATTEIETLLKNLVQKLLVQIQSNPSYFDSLFIELLKTPMVHTSGYYDLGLLCKILFQVYRLEEAKILENALYHSNHFVTDKVLYLFFDELDLAGVSIYFPHNWAQFNYSIAQDHFNFYQQLTFSQRTNWHHLIDAYVTSIRDRKNEILMDLVDKTINYGQYFQVCSSKDPIYNEAHLFLLAEVSFYPLIDAGNYQLLEKYIQTISSTSYQSDNFDNHKNYLSQAILRKIENVTDPAEQEQLRCLIKLLNFMEN